MGSSGTGNFGDYKPTGTRCDESIDTELEDVATMPFYNPTKKLPTSGVAVRVRADPFDGRLVVEDVASGLALGNLPTSYNYLILCIKKGYRYEGTVSAASPRPVPTIDVHLDSI